MDKRVVRSLGWLLSWVTCFLLSSQLQAATIADFVTRMNYGDISDITYGQGERNPVSPNGAWAYRLNSSQPNSHYGTVDFHFPPDIPQQHLNTLEVYSEFLMYNANDYRADGFSFRYGSLNGSYDLYGDYSGLLLLFQNGVNGGPNQNTVKAYYNGRLLGQSGPIDILDAGFEGKWNIFTIDFTPSTGLTVNILQFDGIHDPAVIANICQNVPIPEWNPQDNWDFRFIGYSGAYACDTLLNNIFIYGDTDPTLQSFSDGTNSDENTPGYVPVVVGDLEDVNAVVLSATSSDQSVVPDSGITFTGTGANRTMIVQPTHNQFGTALITVTARQGSGSVTRYLGYTVNHTVIPPQIDPIPNLTLTEDAAPLTLYLSGINGGDVRFPTSVTMTVASDNPTLLPDPILQYAGGSSGVLTLNPNLHQSGVANVTLTLSDGNTTTNATFSLTVTPINHPPVIGSGSGIRLGGLTNSYLVVSNVGSLIPQNGVTVEFWQKANLAQQETTFKLQPEDPLNEFSASVPAANGAVEWSFGDTFNGFGGFIWSPFNNVIGSWHHWAFVQDSISASIYQDGILVAQQSPSSPFTQTTADLIIGGISGGGLNPFDGEIGEFRVWTQARAASQIQQFMNQAVPTNDPSLLIYYQFNEGSGNVVHDLASDAATQGGSQDATLFNGPEWESNIIDGPPQTLPLLAVENLASDILLPAFDLETPANSLLYTNVTVSGGSIQQTHPGTWRLTRFTPPTNFNGILTIHYEVSDVPTSATISNTLAIVVRRVNLPPIISAIPDQTVEENTPFLNVPFQVTDDKPSTDVSTFVQLSDPSLATATITSDAGGTNRILILSPATNQIGSLQVTVVAVDKELGQTTNQFEVRIEPPPAYGIVDLGILPGKSTSFGLGINDQGAVVGYAADNGVGLNPEGFVFNGLENGGVLSILTPFNGYSRPLAINNDFVTVGTAVTNGLYDGFLNAATGLLDLGLSIGSSSSVVTSVGGAGAAAGYGTFAGGVTNSFVYVPGLGSALIPNPMAPFNAGETAAGINLNADVTGTAFSADGSRQAFLYRYSTGTTSLLGILGDTNSLGLGINNFGEVVGGLTTNGIEQAFVWSAGSVNFLGGLTAGGMSEGRSINDFGQVAGTAQTTNGDAHAVVFSSGRLRDLNDLIPEEDAQSWILTEGNAINRSGAVVGTGTYNGVRRAFLALPATVIGTPVLRPLGAVVRNPQITILRRNLQDDNVGNSFLWNQLEGQLYAIRPVIARIDWYTSLNDTVGASTNLTINTSRITTVSINVWPKKPNIHIVTAPVQLEPDGFPFPYSFQSILFQTNSSTVEPSTKTFSAAGPGYSVIYYLKSEGQIANPITQHPHFEVVRSYLWNDPAVLPPDQPHFVGDELVDPLHSDYNGRNGFVVFSQSAYDGAGANRAYNRDTRLGTIIPVNTKHPSGLPLSVVWYRTNQVGIAWASVPVRYSLAWPDNPARKIIIASTLGSGVLDDPTYPSKQVYVQSDPTLPGFNPNEEHALLGSSLGGEALFALRCDLNTIDDLSAPYALLKFKDPITGKWRINPYKVVAEESPYFFKYGGIAGSELQAPMPLPLLPICDGSMGVTGPYWRDYKGKFYAKAAGPLGTGTNIVLRYYYPLQAGFYFPGTNASVGQCVAWLDRLHTNNPIGQPVDINFAVSWTNYPILQVGQTLLKAKNGLPSVYNMAAAKIIFDDLDLNPNFDDGLARFYDPISARTLSTPITVPGDLRRNNVAGKDEFSDLAWQLRVRLGYDSVNRQLSFKGYLDENFSAGDPLLLPNVMSERERDSIKALTSTLSQQDKKTWSDAIDALYDLTRNPNGVDLSPKDGIPDKALRLGLTMAQNYVVREDLGSGPKALTAGVQDVPPAVPNPLQAVSLNGTTGHLPIGSSGGLGALSLQSSSFTIEFWAKLNQLSKEQYIVSQDGPDNFGKLRIGFRAGGEFAFDLGTTSASKFNTAFQYADLNWHHWACVLDATSGIQSIYLDGHQVAIRTNTTSFIGSGIIDIGRAGSSAYFNGQLDEFRLWRQAQLSSDIPHFMHKRLLGTETGLAVYYRFDEGQGTVTRSSAPGGYDATLAGGVSWVASTAPAAIPPRYITVAENNDSSLPGLPVVLHVIQIDDGPYLGDLKVLAGDNVFDERVTIRHSPDFGGDPGRLYFEWYYKPQGPDFDPTDLPVVAPDGTIADPRGWTALPTRYLSETSGRGFNYVTIGEGQESSLITLSDNGFIGRYHGYSVGLSDTNTWSGWVGDPSGTPTQPRAALVEGWVKRVIRGLNPFDARTADFHSSPSSTYASILIEAGHRYEGDIAFNPSADNLNGIGLIEAYQTVLNRAKSLSVDASPGVDFNPANNALLLAATKISDLYNVLGNEAYADAQDPTIGFGSSSTEYGTLSSSIFAFENQLDSLLDEELALLRGRDDSAAGVAAAPVYNRLYWNFTLGEGEIAYRQVYNISDQNGDGFINDQDARIMYPQGHGDAWGHYLTAIVQHYALLRHPNFTWIPRSEEVNVAGVAVEVDFLDERKFALTASAKAKTGKEIMELTYRSKYVDDPSGQWQGYKDENSDRAWGVSEWARRAGQGAYFDWVVANAILPAVDPNPHHSGIEKIDRTTVVELREIASQANEIQSTLNQADVGLNPLGLAKGVVPFDIDPSAVATGQTHFEQIQQRAIGAMNNALAVWDQANKSTENLRKSQDSVEQFTANVNAQENDYKNRLIEIFGYPYTGDVGPGKTYQSGYDGPDLVHYMYVGTAEITGETAPPSTNFTAFFAPLISDFGKQGVVFPSDGALGTNGQSLDSTTIAVSYPFSAGTYAFAAPTQWGQRRAPGELQSALSDVVQRETELKRAMREYDNLIQSIDLAKNGLKGQFNVDAEKVKINDNKDKLVKSLEVLGVANTAVKTTMERASAVAEKISDDAANSLPTVVGLDNDITAPVRGAIQLATALADSTFDIASDAADIAEASFDVGKDEAESQAEDQIAAAEVKGKAQDDLKKILELVRQEAPKRLEMYNQREILNQAAGRYFAALAKGQRLIEERVAYRKRVAAQTTESRYQDMTFRIFRNDALQQYRAQFDLAARYVYLAATAYDYETQLLQTDNRSGGDFLTDIIRQQSLGQITGGVPTVGVRGLADPLGRLSQNFGVLKGQLGFNNPQTESGRFSVRKELFRVRDGADDSWRTLLKQHRVANIWDMPEFRRYCKPFASEDSGPQPGIVIRFPTTVTSGLNFFGWPLGGGDSAYDPSHFATRVRSAGVWFSDYNGSGLSQTPRVYLFPAGQDILRAPSDDSLATRQWRVVDQVLPVPFPIGASSLKNEQFIPIDDSLGGNFVQIRRFAGLRAYHDNGGFTEAEATTDTRLIGRSVWNTDWILIIPGATLLSDADQGLDGFIDSVSDIKFFFQTYSYSGN